MNSRFWTVVAVFLMFSTGWALADMARPGTQVLSALGFGFGCASTVRAILCAARAERREERVDRYGARW